MRTGLPVAWFPPTVFHSINNMNVMLLTNRQGDPALFAKSAANLSSEHTVVVAKSIGELWRKLTIEENPLPNLIFLDAELSRCYDQQLVNMLKSNSELKPIPIVVFADSADFEDITVAYNLPIACFVVLPTDLKLRQAKIEACLEFWSTFAELPELRRWWPRDTRC